MAHDFLTYEIPRRRQPEGEKQAAKV
jgi:ribonuclease Z